MSLIGAPKPGMIKPRPTGRQQVAATLARMVPGRAHRVDAVFTLAVVLCLLIGLRTVVFGWQGWRAAAVGVVLGFVVGHIQATYRWPLVATVLFGGVLYLLLGGPLAVREDLKWALLPTGQTFKDLIAGPTVGWMDLLTLVPPVDARARALATVLFIALLSTVLVYATARVTRSRWRLLLTPLVLLAVIIALGTAQPAAPWVQGLALGLLLIGWLIARDHLDPRAGIRRPRAPRPAPSRVIAGTVLLLLAALIGSLLGPRLAGLGGPQDRQVARTGVVPGHDVRVLASPLSGFREFTRSGPRGWYHRELLHVDGVTKTTPMRLATLDSWDGANWGIAGRSDGRVDTSRSFQQIGRRVGALAGGTPSEVTVTVPEDGYAGPWLLTTGRVEGIRFRGGSARRLRDEAWLNLSTDTVLVPASLRPGDAYELRTELPPTGFGALPDDLRVARGGLPITGESTFVDDRISAWSAEIEDPWQSFVKIATVMREEGTYTDGSPAVTRQEVEEDERTKRVPGVLRHPAGHGRDRLDDFLNSDPLAGNDEQYAAALALIGNRLGIPTRVVVGATATKDGTIRGRDIHAWVEVRQEEGGWFQVLPATFLPDRPTPKGDPEAWRADDPAPLAEPPAPTPPAPEPTFSWSAPSTWPLWVHVLAVFAGGPLLLGLLTPGIGAARGLLRARRGRPDQRVGRAWRDLADEARALGRDVPERGTRVEQATALGPHIDALPTALRADSLIFDAEPPAPDAVAAWHRELRTVRRRLRRHSPRWVRLLATFDPRPLFSRRVDIGLHDTTTAPSRKALR